MAAMRALTLLVLVTAVSGKGIQQARRELEALICGKTNSSGVDSEVKTEFRQPWRVELRSYNEILSRTLACGGALVNERFVVTAAHCVDGPEWYLTIVRIGNHGIDELKKSHPYEDYRIRRKIVHELFAKVDGSRFINDVALLELTAAVRFRQHIVPICLPQTGQNFSGVSAWISETLYAGSSRSSKFFPPQKLDMIVMGNDSCTAWYEARGLNESIHEATLCASFSESVCDRSRVLAGLPLVMERNGRAQAIGIVSWSEPCDASGVPGLSNAPTVLTSISYHLKWIQANLEARPEVPEIDTDKLYLLLYVFMGLSCICFLCWVCSSLEQC